MCISVIWGKVSKTTRGDNYQKNDNAENEDDDENAENCLNSLNSSKI